MMAVDTLYVTTKAEVSDDILANHLTGLHRHFGESKFGMQIEDAALQLLTREFALGNKPSTGLTHVQRLFAIQTCQNAKTSPHLEVVYFCERDLD